MKVLAEPLLRRVIMSYGLDFRSLVTVISGYRNVSHIVETNQGLCNLILYKHEPRIVDLIHRVNVMGRYLHDCGMPVRVPADERIVQLQSQTVTRYGCLYHHLPGETIAWEMYSMKHLKLLGWALGDIHRALVDYPERLPDVRIEYQTIVMTMRQYFRRHDVALAMADKLKLSCRDHVFTWCDAAVVDHPDLPTCALHMDFVRGNVLFRPARNGRYRLGTLELSGILDLEKAACGPREFDIARTLAFLLVDSVKPPDKIIKYFIDSGYYKRGQAGSLRQEWVDQLISVFLLYDFYKFLRDNPYESLQKNHHFVRTRDILVQRQMLQ